MKKILLLIAVVGMTAFTSCSGDDDSAPAVTAITLTASSTQVDLGVEVDLSVQSNLNTDVTATSTFTANGTAISGATFSSLTAGTYSIVATYNGVTSNTVTVTVLPTTYALHNGVSILPTRNALIYYGTGDVLGDGVNRSYWSYVTYIGTSAADVETSAFMSEVDFFTTYDVANNVVVLPNEGANTFYTLYTLRVGGTEIVSTTAEGQVNGTGTVVTNAIADDASTADFVTDITYNTDKTLRVKYVGINEFFNASGRPAAKGVMAAEEMVTMEEIKSRKAAFTVKK
jgi:hypothetical protein